MNEFITWEFLTTYGGMVAAVTILTQVIKGYIPRLDPKWTALIIAFIGQIGVQLLFRQDYSVQGIFMALINVFMVLAGSVGAYEVAVKPAVKAMAKHEDGDA